MGSPAVSAFISSFRRAITSFFFNRRTAASHFANALYTNITGLQLATPQRDRLHIDSGDPGYLHVAPMSQSYRFQSQIQPTLFFVQNGQQRAHAFTYLVGLRLDTWRFLHVCPFDRFVTLLQLAAAAGG